MTHDFDRYEKKDNIKRVRVGTSKRKSNIDGSRNIKPTFLDTYEDETTAFHKTNMTFCLSSYYHMQITQSIYLCFVIRKVCSMYVK